MAIINYPVYATYYVANHKLPPLAAGGIVVVCLSLSEERSIRKSKTVKSIMPHYDVGYKPMSLRVEEMAVPYLDNLLRHEIGGISMDPVRIPTIPQLGSNVVDLVRPNQLIIPSGPRTAMLILPQLNEATTHDYAALSMILGW